MKKKLGKLIVMVLAMTLMLATMTVFASAKQLKPKKTTFSTDTATVNKVAKKVKKGTYTVKVPANAYCYLKFTAPKTKTYNVTVSAVKPLAGRSIGLGFFHLLTPSSYSNSYLSMADAKTQGGSAASMLFGSRAVGSGDTKEKYLTKRYGKLNLKAGQTMYICFSTASVNSLKCSIK